MKRKIVVLLAVTMILMVAVTVAYAHGHNADQLGGRNWTCANAGPHNWIHCFPPKVDFPADISADNHSTIQVKVFSEDGHEFFGTEILVHKDIYNGQPCMTDNGEPYAPLGNYYACHHFSTPHDE